MSDCIVSVYTREDGLADGVLLRLEEWLPVDDTIAELRRTRGRFALGELVITAAAAAKLKTTSVIRALRRHQSRDWGDLDEEDYELNQQAVKDGGRVFSVYYGKAKEQDAKPVRFYVITEWNREATTVLLPEDY